MIDEETIRRNFKVWAATQHYCLRFLTEHDEYDYSNTQSAWEAWLEATRLADRRAREECAEICGKVWVQKDNVAVDAVRSCQEAIRATIKEE